MSTGCCKSFLSEFGCDPWAISRLETTLHAIPGVGIFTSACNWAYKSSQIAMIDTSLAREDVAVIGTINHLVEDMENSDDERENPFLKNQDVTLFDDTVLESNDDFLKDQRLELTAQRANCKALFAINLFGSIATAATFYTMKMLNEI